MASSDGLRIGKASLGTVAAVIVTVMGIAATHASQLSTRVGGLERQYATLEVKQENLEKQLDYMTTILEKLRDRP